jgi:hypothetical protein
MSDPILEKLDTEWRASIRSKDYATAGKILRAKLNCLKSAGILGEHKESLSEWVKTLEDKLEGLSCEVSLTVIGHLRHARKSLSITTSDVGSAFRSEISRKDRARFRERNRPPVLGIAHRADLPAGYLDGSPRVHLQSDGLGTRSS